MSEQREKIPFDVVIVGGGVAGLATAIRLQQLANNNHIELDVCVIEKGAEIGSHILSGAVIETRALDELVPDWQSLNPTPMTKVSTDKVAWLFNPKQAIGISKNKLSVFDKQAIGIPKWAVPKTMHNQGNYIVSLGALCRWLGEYAENLGIHIFTGFAGAEILYNESGAVCGVATGEMGIAKNGGKKSNYQQGIELHAKHTIFAEGSHGHLGKQLIQRFNLSEGKDPQHYGIGIKEVWEVPTDKHQSGLVMHTAGWPLSESYSTGGGFVYHFGDNLVAVGLITDLSYRNPYISPFDEMQRYKTHPMIKQYLSGGKRIAYGARTISKGGLQSLPTMHFAGGLLIGDNAGTLNFAKIKGIHTAMKSGMIAAEVMFDALIGAKTDDHVSNDDLYEYETALKQSWVYQELYQQRNFGPAQHKWGNLLGSAYGFLDINLFNGKLPWTLRDKTPDYANLKPTKQCKKISYPAPDNELTFDRLSSLYLTGLSHDEDQPIHLHLSDSEIPITDNLSVYEEPAQRYCPAAVYEIVEDIKTGENKLQINAQNCIHCKTCDIKDPAQNITWETPEGGSGPNYSNM